MSPALACVAALGAVGATSCEISGPGHRLVWRRAGGFALIEPREGRDVLPEEPQAAAQLALRLIERLDAERAARRTLPRDPAADAALRRLGYLQR